MSDNYLSKPTERLHIYRVPERLDEGFAFNGGNPISFLNVDFFDAPWDITHDEIKAFIAKKRYFDPRGRFLVLASSKYPTLTFTIEPRTRG
jgi:hypothetical protein